MDHLLALPDFANILTEGIYIVDRNGIIVFVNDEWVLQWGINRSHAVGHNVFEVAKALELEYYRVEDGNIVGMQNEMYRGPVVVKVMEEKKNITMMSGSPSGDRMLAEGTPIFDEAGELRYVVTAFWNLTSLTGLNENLEYQSVKGRAKGNGPSGLNESSPGGDLIGSSPNIVRIRSLISQVAKTDATILITGETGVGKEVIANEIFKKSLRSGKPFVKVNCAAIPENLVESELFGYEAGAFTGANKLGKQGLFDVANEGTIMLDEVGDFPLQLQAKLLRALQSKEIARIGAVKTTPIDVRVIAATSQNLLQLIEQGKFREDLYYRLSVIPIIVPPLREREMDIELLAHAFLERYNDKYRKRKRLGMNAIRGMRQYSWPGNIREMENIMERLVIIGNEKVISGNRVKEELDNCGINCGEQKANLPSLSEAVNDLERDMIQSALSQYGSTYKAAKVLRVAQSTVVRKAKMLGITGW